MTLHFADYMYLLWIRVTPASIVCKFIFYLVVFLSVSLLGCVRDKYHEVLTTPNKSTTIHNHEHNFTTIVWLNCGKFSSILSN